MSTGILSGPRLNFRLDHFTVAVFSASGDFFLFVGYFSLLVSSTIPFASTVRLPCLWAFFSCPAATFPRPSLFFPVHYFSFGEWSADVASIRSIFLSLAIEIAQKLQFRYQEQCSATSAIMLDIFRPAFLPLPKFLLHSHYYNYWEDILQ